MMWWDLWEGPESTTAAWGGARRLTLPLGESPVAHVAVGAVFSVVVTEGGKGFFIENPPTSCATSAFAAKVRWGGLPALLLSVCTRAGIQKRIALARQVPAPAFASTAAPAVSRVPSRCARRLRNQTTFRARRTAAHIASALPFFAPRR